MKQDTRAIHKAITKLGLNGGNYHVLYLLSAHQGVTPSRMIIRLIRESGNSQAYINAMFWRGRELERLELEKRELQRL